MLDLIARRYGTDPATCAGFPAEPPGNGWSAWRLSFNAACRRAGKARAAMDLQMAAGQGGSVTASLDVGGGP